MAKKIVFNVKEEQYKNILKMQEKRDFFNISETLRYCISETTSRELDNYKELEKAKLKARVSPQERLSARLQAEDARNQHKKDRAIESRAEVCESMGGRVTEENGVKMCTYATFTEHAQTKQVEKNETTIPLEAVGDDLPQYQFRDMFGQTGDEVKKKLTKKYNEQSTMA